MDNNENISDLRLALNELVGDFTVDQKIVEELINDFTILVKMQDLLYSVDDCKKKMRLLENSLYPENLESAMMK